jgi:leader peptidase (prepilin peptidase)/N-methyltransferase
VTLAIDLIAALFGLVIGSFLNVVIDRVPKHESVVSPRSRCPRCGAGISPRDNIPIVSWLVLRGKCRSCSLPISAQYPLVEFVTALIFGFTAAHFGAGWNLAVFLVLFTGLVPLAIIDLYQHLLPVRIFYPVIVLDSLILLGAAIATGDWRHFLIAVATGTVWFLMFFIINWVRPDALGFGDVRLVALLGLCLGWLGVPIAFVGFFASNLLALTVGIYLIARKHANRKSPIPLGLFLAIGTVFAVFAGSVIVNHIRGLR